MWKLALNDDLVMVEGTLTAGEAEMIFTTAIQGGIPHSWNDIERDGPYHCPACLNAHAITLLVSRGEIQPVEAAKFIAGTDFAELKSKLSTIDAPDDPAAAGAPDNDPEVEALRADIEGNGPELAPAPSG